MYSMIVNGVQTYWPEGGARVKATGEQLVSSFKQHGNIWNTNVDFNMLMLPLAIYSKS